MKTSSLRLILRHSLLILPIVMGGLKVFGANTPAKRQQASENPKSWNVSWMMGLSSQNERAETQTYDAAGLLAGVKIQQAWNELLSFNGDIGAEVKSGQRESVDGNRPVENAFKLYEASVGVGYRNGLKTDLGVLDSHAHHSVLMFERRGYPGARPEFTYVSPGQEFTVFGEALAPQSLEIRSASGEKAGMPAFYSGGVEQKFRWTTRLESHWSASAFQFQGLNQSVQNTSTFLGNTAKLGSNADLAQLKYEYQGFEIDQSHKLLLAPNFLTEVSGDYLTNTAAPAGRNSAYRGMLSLTTVLAPKYHMITEAEGFHIEPDAVLGAYSNPAYFNANRNGYRVGLGLYLKSEKLKITGSYTEAQTIYINPPQTREQLIYLRLETIYDRI